MDLFLSWFPCNMASADKLNTSHRPTRTKKVAWLSLGLVVERVILA